MHGDAPGVPASSFSPSGSSSSSSSTLSSSPSSLPADCAARTHASCSTTPTPAPVPPSAGSRALADERTAVSSALPAAALRHRLSFAPPSASASSSSSSSGGMASLPLVNASSSSTGGGSAMLPRTWRRRRSRSQKAACLLCALAALVTLLWAPMWMGRDMVGEWRDVMQPSRWMGPMYGASDPPPFDAPMPGQEAHDFDVPPSAPDPLPEPAPAADVARPPRPSPLGRPAPGDPAGGSPFGSGFGGRIGHKRPSDAVLGAQLLPLGYEEPPSEASDRAVLNSSAFPPQLAYMSASMAMAAMANAASPRPADPHLGEIPEHLLSILRAERKFVPPPRPKEQGWTSTTASQPRWLRWRDGSNCTRADAMHPERLALEEDWRTEPYDGWKPPLEELRKHLDAKKTQMPKVQHAFEAPERHSGRRGDEEREALIRERQRLVKNAFLHAWDGYKALAWGHDELRPVTQLPHDNFNGWGATIVDALDTLLVMELRDDYDVARQHVRDIDFTFVGGTRSAYGTSDGRVPVFETVIRYLGGLLSAHDLAGDDLMLERAEELAQLILPAFETSSGIPQGRLRLGAPPLRGKVGAVVLAEAGSHLLEMTRLWQLTGNRTYFDKVQRTTDWLDRNTSRSDDRLGTLLPTTLFPESSNMFGTYSLGGMADSYYEYLIKEHQLLGGALQYGRMYAEAMDSTRRWLMRTITGVPGAPSLMTIGQSNGKYFQPKLEHLTCFCGGMLGLGARLLNRERDLTSARRFSETCWWAYNATATGIGPEELQFYADADEDRFEVLYDTDGTASRGKARGNPFVGVRSMNGDYRNRPETIESVLYMWRITGDPVWQERGWQMFASWVTHSMTDVGFSSILDVMQVPAQQTDSMESYAFAETFKYYYLLFSPPDLISLDEYVFTTEAHPLLLPQNGVWGEPGRGRKSFWDASASHEPAPDSQAYSGGEGGVVGGLTHVQKVALLAMQKQQAEAEAARQERKSAQAASAALRAAEAASTAAAAGQAVVARGLELGNDGAAALTAALRRLLNSADLMWQGRSGAEPSAAGAAAALAHDADDLHGSSPAGVPHTSALVPAAALRADELDEQGLPWGHPQGKTSPAQMRRLQEEVQAAQERVLREAVERLRLLQAQGTEIAVTEEGELVLVRDTAASDAQTEDDDEALIDELSEYADEDEDDDAVDEGQ